MHAEFATISPINGRELLRRAYTSDADIQAMLDRARAAQKSWKALPLEQRREAVSQAVDRFVAGKPDLALDITRQMGRPIRHTPGEVDGFEQRARYMIDAADRALAPIHMPPQENLTRFILREPIGIVLTVAPWNYPLLTAVNSIVPALMAGNAVILKHSDQTPLCAESLHDAFGHSGLPPGLFQFVHASHDTVRRLIQAPEIGYVSFTGSVRAGKAVEQAAAGLFMGTGLELGGNDPAYVRADADLDHAVETLVDGAYFNSGQSCCGIQRIYVEQDIYREFIDRAASLTQRYVLGDPLDPATTLGPVVRLGAAQEIRKIIRDAEHMGARNLVDARSFAAAADTNCYVPPALLVDATHDMGIMNDECFGPVAGVMPVRGDAEAIRLMNDSRYGLTAAVFTRDQQAALEIGRQIETGTFFMNRCDYLDPALAWTGVKNTGRGVSLSTLGYEPLTRPRSFHLRSLQANHD